MNRLLLLGFMLCLDLTFAQIKEQLVHEDSDRSWLTYVLDNYSESKSYPLLIELRGGGGHTWPAAKKQRLISKMVGATTQDFNACDKL